MAQTRQRLDFFGGASLMFSILLVILASPVGPVFGQSVLTEHTVTLDDPEARYTLDLDAADWLVGTWRGDGFGGTVEEVWLPAAHDQMIGAFRFYGVDEEGFSELMALAHVDGHTLLRVKHFNPDFTGWESQEESVDFRFVSAGDRSLHFGGLTLDSPAPDVLYIYIAMRGEDGVKEETLRYRRVPK